MTPSKNTKPVHLIKIKCDNCKGDKTFPASVSYAGVKKGTVILPCLECTNGIREWLVWLPKVQLTGITSEGRPYILHDGGISTGGSEDWWDNIDQFIKPWYDDGELEDSGFSPYQSGDTVSTQVGDRIAGEVSLILFQNMIHKEAESIDYRDSDGNSSGMANSLAAADRQRWWFTVLKHDWKLPWTANPYLCIAGSLPVTGKN